MSHFHGIFSQGKKKFEATDDAPEQKCKCKGTWEGNSIKWQAANGVGAQVLMLYVLQYEYEYNDGVNMIFYDAVDFWDNNGDGNIETEDSFEGGYRKQHMIQVFSS